mgnify:CR=1 FL=1
MDIVEILKMYNEDGLTLVEIGNKLNSSKSSISRFLAKEGYVFNKTLKKYVQNDVNIESNTSINNVSRETINKGNNKILNTVKCTFDLPAELAKALKIKSAVEGVKMVDIVRKVLEKSIEKKYFDM